MPIQTFVHSARRRALLCTLSAALLLLACPHPALAQRELHWDLFEVTAHLNADGTLRVAETQTMVFTGDWNGGERQFNIRPRQKLEFNGIFRGDGAGWQELTEDGDLDSVDDFAWTDSKTLRWRSRLRSDPPFANTFIKYQLRYVLSGILLKEGDGYLLNHDFAFPDREGVIDRFALRLTLDPGWQAQNEVREVYMVSGLPPGEGFVLRLPLRFVGAGSPSTLDLSRPPEIRLAVSIILGVTLAALGWFFVREESNGRFAALPRGDVSEAWLREHILKYPAEVIGAAWDDKIGPAEVVALIARMTSEGKLESTASGSGVHSSMTLHLKVDKSALEGYERKLVDALFFNGRTKTSTDDVKRHYQKEGFNPVSVIEKDLEESLQSAFPFGAAPRKFRLETLVVFLFGLVMLVAAWTLGYINGVATVLVAVGSGLFAAFATIPGAIFRTHMDWGRGRALLCLIPAVTIAAVAAAFLWYYAGTGIVELETTTLLAIVALALGMTNSSINSLKSRQRRPGIGVRKMLAAGREFFLMELQKDRPALRDDWYPWVLAFGLGKQADDWTTQRPGSHDSSTHSTTVSSSGSSSSSSPGSWTGFGGGRSGGAGGGASWAAAAGGMAAGVSPPSSSGSGGGSSGGGSSGGGSSGGGGGGGW